MEKLPDITVKYINEVHSQIIARKEIIYALKDAYSFFADGYKFHPLFKQGRWNGKISMIDAKGIFYSGLLKDVLKHCKEKGLSIKIGDISKYKNSEISDSEVEKLASYSNIKPYDYQLASIKASLTRRKMLCLSPTSSGKSLISYMLYRYCVDNNIKMLITVPSIMLVEQLYSDFESYVADDHKVEDYVDKICDGQNKDSKKQVIISTWQTAINMDKEWLHDFGFYICDEAHQASGKSISSIIDNLVNCRYRIGLTGTLNGAEMHELEMQARFGDVFKMVTTRELIDRGIVSDIKINAIKLTRDKATIDHFHGLTKSDYQREIDYLVNSPERNGYLTDLALTLPTNTLMLFNYIDAHGMKLLDIMNSKRVQYKKKVFYISGSVKKADRTIIKKTMDSDLPVFYDLTFDNGSTAIIDGEDLDINNLTKYLHDRINLEEYGDQVYIDGDVSNANLIDVKSTEGAYILLATYGTLAVGVSIRRLHNLIFAHPYKARIRNLQSIGRLLRKSEVKNKVFLYDIIDDYRKGKKTNHCYKHAIQRLEIYEEEEFEYDIIEKRI